MIRQGIKDVMGGSVLIPAPATPGERGGLAFPGEYDGFRSATAGNDWRNETRAALALLVAFWRTVAQARKLGCPVLVQAGRRDLTVSLPAIQKLAQPARGLEVVRR